MADDAPVPEVRVPLAELERQVERGSMFTQAVFQKSFTRLSTLEAVVWELVESLLEKGAVDVEDLPGAAAARVELDSRADAARQPATLPWPAVALRVDPAEPKPVDPVNCSERLPVCKGVCCRLKFALSQEEVERGLVKWDIGHPYVIRQDSTGYCTHNDPGSHHCGVYRDRPRLCQDYSCRNDRRIWTDFEGMVLNQAWIDEHLAGGDAIYLVDDDSVDDEVVGGGDSADGDSVDRGAGDGGAEGREAETAGA